MSGLQDLSAAFKPLRDGWQALPPRERRLVWLAASVLGLYLVWALAVQPAWRTLAQAPAQLDTLGRQLQAMQLLAGEARELRDTPAVTPDQAAAALRAATERLGDQGSLTLQGDRAVLKLSGVGTSALRDWLAQARSGARARAVDVKLTRSGRGYDGTLVVAFGSAP
jgi:general secretion pathway protein M